MFKRGAKKLAYVGGSLELNLLSNQRYQAFKEKAGAAGFSVKNYQCQLDSFDRREYQQLAARIFSENKEIV